MWIAILRPCREQYNGAIPLAATSLNHRMRACPLAGSGGPFYAAAGALGVVRLNPPPAASRGVNRGAPLLLRTKRKAPPWVVTSCSL
jgi:hypothetical protein